MKYRITLKPGFTGPRRRRAGIELAAGGSAEVELTKEQLDALKSDPIFVVRQVKEDKPAPKSTSKQMVDKQDAKEA